MISIYSKGHDLCAVRGYVTGCPNHPRDDSKDHKGRTLGDDTYHACQFDMDGEKVLRFVGSDMPPLLEELRTGHDHLSLQSACPRLGRRAHSLKAGTSWQV